MLIMFTTLYKHIKMPYRSNISQKYSKNFYTKEKICYCNKKHYLFLTAITTKNIKDNNIMSDIFSKVSV
ncbi:hypothetical protein EWN88_25325 [Salmonella enterica]|nr:hypothetical protein [Salmonella enterica]EAC1542088.1 hypothetical protein [Salmonella enterica subsp. enterica]EAM5403089.1 hypothetical protein [Salmonella enterica]EAN8864786.1 hypothetical protein [Salmonella enterica]EAQ6980211.1 hypothetical protein [Salmonella enterica]